MKYLYTVHEVFDVRNKGVTLVLCPPNPVDPDVVYKVGDPIVLSKPDGQSIKTRIASIEIARGSPWHPIVVHELSKDDVPVGTKVYLDDTQSE